MLTAVALNTPEELAQAADMFKLELGEFRQPYESMFSAGLEKLSRMRKALVWLMKQRQRREIEQSRERGVSEDILSKHQREYDMQLEHATRGPLWKMVSGIPDTEDMPDYPRERRRALTVLVNAVRRLCAWELLHGEKDEDSLANSFPTPTAADENTGPSLLEPLVKTPFWDPLQAICAAMGIARVALSRFAKEANGLAAHEIVDVVKVQDVKRRLRETLFPQLRELLLEKTSSPLSPCGRGVGGKGSPCGREAGGQGNGDGLKRIAEERAKGALKASDVWRLLKAQRTEPEFNRAIHAQELGFPNYHRYYKACLAKFRQAPSQIELELIEEFLNECVRASEGSTPATSGEQVRIGRASAAIKLADIRPDPQQVQNPTADPQGDVKAG